MHGTDMKPQSEFWWHRSLIWGKHQESLLTGIILCPSLIKYLSQAYLVLRGPSIESVRDSGDSYD